MILAQLEPYADEFEFEDFTFEIDDYFTKHLNKEVFIESKNLTWRNLKGTKTFTLIDVHQVWRELVPQDTDYSFVIEDTNKKNIYQARCSHHDCPTGEKFTITFKERKNENK